MRLKQRPKGLILIFFWRKLDVDQKIITLIIQAVVITC
jgi:hypothetical protein